MGTEVIQGSVLLIDANNVRGELGFPALHRFVDTACDWASSVEHEFVLIAIDHGPVPTALQLRKNVAVAFSGPHSDADTVIVHTVDWLLDSYRSLTVTVVSNDRMLLRRCRFGLPASDEDSWYDAHGVRPPTNPEFDTRGLRRSDTQQTRLKFLASMELGRQLAAHDGSVSADGHDEAYDDDGNAPTTRRLRLTLTRWLRWLFGDGAPSPTAADQTYRTRRSKSGKLLSKPTRRRRRSHRENSALRVRTAAELLARLQSAGAPMSTEDHVHDTGSLAAFTHWFATDRRLQKRTQLGSLTMTRATAAGGQRIAPSTLTSVSMVCAVVALVFGVLCVTFAAVGRAHGQR